MNVSVLHPSSYTLEAENGIDTNAITVSLSGVLHAGSRAKIGRAIERGRNLRKRVLVDLSEVTLVDRLAVAFLNAQVADDVAQENRKDTQLRMCHDIAAAGGKAVRELVPHGHPRDVAE
jgi:hypothetical protein